MKYEIDEETIVALLHYLQTRPYNEVIPLIARLYVNTGYKTPKEPTNVGTREEDGEANLIDITPANMFEFDPSGVDCDAPTLVSDKEES